MEAALGLLLLMLLGVSQGLEMSCDGRQNGAECYGPLGGAALIQLMDDASQIPRFKLFKDNILRLRWVGQLITNLTGSRYTFTASNGTFGINNLSRDDAGTYKLSMINQTTGETTDQSVILHVEEPVSSARLSLGCLSLGERTAFCVSEGGENLHYNWTLNGGALTDTQLIYGNSSTANITLRQTVSGELICRVWNNVSSVSKKEQMSTCGFIFVNCTSNGTQISEWVPAEKEKTLCSVTPDPDSHNSSSPNSGGTDESPDGRSPEDLVPMIAGALSALLILLVIGVAIICTQRGKKSKLVQGPEAEREPTYADVTVLQRPSRRGAPRTPDPEVEYGQIKFSARPRQAPGGAQDADGQADGCVYAQVRRVR